MIISKELAKNLEILLNPAVEEAILLLLQELNTQNNQILTNFNATEAELRKLMELQLKNWNAIKEKYLQNQLCA